LSERRASVVGAGGAFAGARGGEAMAGAAVSRGTTAALEAGSGA
jgi:hypothetical protein